MALAVVSHRLPTVNEERNILAESSGGLVTGMMGVVTPKKKSVELVRLDEGRMEVAENVVWFGWNDVIDPHAAVLDNRTQVKNLNDGVNLVGMSKTPSEHYAQYTYFADQLWQASHNQSQHMTKKEIKEAIALFDKFKATNGVFAEQFAAHHLKPEHDVWVHDYQLLTMPAELRKLGVQNNIFFFLHIPVIEPEVMNSIHPVMKSQFMECYESLFACDRVAFQTKKHLQDFTKLMGMDGVVPEGLEKGEEITLRHGDKTCRFQYCPIGIDVEAVTKMSQDNTVPLVARPEPKMPAGATEEERQAKVAAMMAERAKAFSLYDQVNVKTPQDLKDFAKAAHMVGEVPESPAAGEAVTLRHEGRTIRLAHTFGLVAEAANRNASPRIPRGIASGRADPAKLFKETLEGVDQALDDGLKLEFNVVAFPNRDTIEIYRKTYDGIVRESARINEKHGTADFHPVQHVTGSIPYGQMVGAFRNADFCLVLSERDGMNLVAKEFQAAQDPANPGVLIIGRNVGAAEELAKVGGAIIVENPHDRKEVARAIKRAVSMPLEERVEMNRKAMEVHTGFDAVRWGDACTKPIGGRNDNVKPGDAPEAPSNVYRLPARPAVA
jgi:trehalose-6-phosphate synthase